MQLLKTFSLLSLISLTNNQNLVTNEPPKIVINKCQNDLDCDNLFKNQNLKCVNKLCTKKCLEKSDCHDNQVCDANGACLTTQKPQIKAVINIVTKPIPQAIKIQNNNQNNNQNIQQPNQKSTHKPAKQKHKKKKHKKNKQKSKESNKHQQQQKILFNKQKVIKCEQFQIRNAETAQCQFVLCNPDKDYISQCQPFKERLCINPIDGEIQCGRTKHSKGRDVCHCQYCQKCQTVTFNGLTVVGNFCSVPFFGSATCRSVSCSKDSDCFKSTPVGKQLCIAAGVLDDCKPFCSSFSGWKYCAVQIKND